MKCPVCQHGETRVSFASATLERGATRLVFHGVPAQVCEICGETSYSEEVTRALLAQAEAAVRAGVEKDERRYAAA